MKDLAFSKINLSLNVENISGKFHPIDSVVVSVDCCDVVSVTPRKDFIVNVGKCKNIRPQENVACKAAREFCRVFGTRGCNVRIKKRIPLAAGLGGSSADAASVVRCLCKIYDVDIKSEKVHELCAELGSDVNFLLHGGFARMTGKGDDLEFLHLSKPIYFAVTVFDRQLFAKDVYARFDEVGGEICNNDRLLAALMDGDFSALSICNGLQRAATVDDNFAEKYLSFCKNNALNCCMTGSGSAFFVPCAQKSDAQKVTKKLRSVGFKTFICKNYPC